MGGVIVPALAASAGGGLGTALLPLVALAGAVVAAAAVGSLIVAWLQKPKGSSDGAITDPNTAGLLAVGFVSGEASQRWLPATVVLLACEGVIAIEDSRVAGGGDAGRARDIRLVFDSDPRVAFAGAQSRDSATGSLVATFGAGLVRGSTVAVDRVVERNDQLLDMTRGGFLDATQWYREPRPAGRFRAATIGGVVGVALGLVTLAFEGEAADSIAWSAIVIGALALGLRVLLTRWIPLNAAGLELRDRAKGLREQVVSSEVSSLAVGEPLLPWAVLFDEPAVIRRVAEVAERSGAAPAWYRSSAGFSADRLASCLTVVAAELSQPIRVGGALRGDGGRFGVPVVDDNKGWGGGYFAGSGGGGIYGGDGGGGSGGGGFDGRGSDGGGYGGGFDGGGFGGGDGGGGY